MVDFAAAPTTHDADLVEQLPRSSTENLKPRILMLCPPQLPVYMLNDLEWSESQFYASYHPLIALIIMKIYRFKSE